MAKEKCTLEELKVQSIVTALDDDLNEESGLARGAADYLTKPIRTADLAACLRMAAQALGKRRGYPA